MRVWGLDGREHAWALAGREVVGSAETRPRSAGHLRARALLQELYPFEAALEEVPVPGARPPLYLDFVLPRRRLVVEVQGEQHRRFVRLFHGTPRGFLDQRKRDQRKVEFCERNGLALVRLDDDAPAGWAARLREPGPLPGGGPGGPAG